MRFALVSILLAPVVLALAGCATKTAPPPSSAPAQDVVAGQLADARDAYFRGVRAYVREDWDEAEVFFEECRRGLAPAVESSEVHPHDVREAESLLAKSAYFLQKDTRSSLAETLYLCLGLTISAIH